MPSYSNQYQNSFPSPSYYAPSPYNSNPSFGNYGNNANPNIKLSSQVFGPQNNLRKWKKSAIIFW